MASLVLIDSYTPALQRELEARFTLPGPADPDPGARTHQVFRANAEAARRYAPRPYAGPLTLLKAAASPVDDPSCGWRRFAPALDVHELPGDHLSILRAPGLPALLHRLLSR